MANVSKSVIDIIRDSLKVDASGTVRFRSRTGRGSGKAIEIPGEQFDEFVKIITETKENRETLAEQQKTSETATKDK